jgi:hypothetical protein
MLPTKQQVQLRSYQIWEKEGRPHGRDQEHWFRAERELAATDRPVKRAAARSTTRAATKAAPAKKAASKTRKTSRSK